METHFEAKHNPVIQDLPNKGILIENTAIALKEQLSFSPFLEEYALSEGLNYRASELKEYPEILDVARTQIQQLILQRLCTLSDVSEIPFVGQFRATHIVEDIIRRGADEVAASPSGGDSSAERLWEIIGSKATPFVPPKLMDAPREFDLEPRPGAGGSTRLAFPQAAFGGGAVPSPRADAINGTANRFHEALAGRNVDDPAFDRARGGAGPDYDGRLSWMGFRNLSAVRHVLGPWDLMVALAGQLQPRGGANAEGAALVLQPVDFNSGAAPRDRSCQLTQMPRGLGVHGTLPGLVGLPSPSLDWLRAFFADLRPQHRHVGLDDRAVPLFRESRLQMGRLATREGRIARCRQFCRFGCPAAVRARAWEVCLGLGPFADTDLYHFEALCKEVLRQPLLLDLVVNQDTHHVRDSEHFFLFEEQVRAVMLCLVRDAEVPPRAAAAACSSASALRTDAEGRGRSFMHPAYDCVPLQGLALLAAPLMYLYDHPAKAYRLFKVMYCRYWSRLFSLAPIGLPSPSLPLLLKTVDSMLENLDPELVRHVRSLGCPPCALALPWICSGFVGHLAPEEVLLLWDRVMGLDSLVPLAAMAVAIVCFRRQVVLSCAVLQELLEAMTDVSQLRAVPLLQSVLFSA